MNSDRERDEVLRIAGRSIGRHEPSYVIAEISANHRQNYDDAAALVRAAKEVGADAVKLQTYTADTITLASDREEFMVRGGTLWDGISLHDLYKTAYTPWEWQPKLKELADEIGITLFSTPFDETAVDFLEEMGVPAHKVASFELVDLPLLKKIAATGKPVIMSTGMATLDEIGEAVRTLRENGTKELALLKCNSAYPAPPEEMNLRTIPHLSEAFGVPAGLSDHTLGIGAAVAAVSLGACIIEKHFTLSRAAGGPDAAFSIEPDEFRAMVEAVRLAEKAIGGVQYGPTPSQEASLRFRRSLFVVADMKEGDVFTKENVRSIRPAHGLSPKHMGFVIGRTASRDIARGEPLTWELLK